MPSFEEVSNTPTPAFPVVGQPSTGGTWTLVGIYATEAEATQAAQAKVGSPDNWATARVCLPAGSLFADLV